MALPSRHTPGREMEFWSGNRAAAEAVKLARAQVVSAYPITPQTSIVEYIAEYVANGEMQARMVRVESEHSALSAVCGASMVGARTYTASCSQGLQLMSEVLYFTSGMRLPVVMGVANRTLSVPVNIWCDHQDSMVNRDSGWIQLYAPSNQEVYDLTLMAYRVAEHAHVNLPVMVCFDGFVLSHVAEEVELLSPAEAEGFVPRVVNRTVMEVSKPMQFGEVLYPEWYPDFEFKKHKAMLDSAQVLEEVGAEFGRLFGRKYGLVEGYRLEDADVVLLGMGSMMCTARAVADGLRARGERVGVLTVRAFRPFPAREITRLTGHAAVVAVLDRDVGYGTGGMLFPDVCRAFVNAAQRPKLVNFVVGLGGKDIGPATVEKCVRTARQALAEPRMLEDPVFWPDARGAPGGL